MVCGGREDEASDVAEGGGGGGDWCCGRLPR